jgi:hypothetical protein
LSFRTNVCENKDSKKQPLLEAMGEENKKQIIGRRRENCKSRGIAVVYSMNGKMRR